MWMIGSGSRFDTSIAFWQQNGNHCQIMRVFEDT